MSIVKQLELFYPVCDICGAKLLGEDDFPAAVAAKKEAGWRSRSTDGTWEDWCEDCQRRYNFAEGGRIR